MYTSSTIVLLRLKELKKRKDLKRERVIQLAQKYGLHYFFIPDNKAILKKDQTFEITFKLQ